MGLVGSGPINRGEEGREGKGRGLIGLGGWEARKDGYWQEKGSSRQLQELIGGGREAKSAKGWQSADRANVERNFG